MFEWLAQPSALCQLTHSHLRHRKLMRQGHMCVSTDSW